MTYNWPGTIFTWPYSTEDPALMMRQIDEALRRLNAKVDMGGGGGGAPSTDPGNMATVGSDGGVYVPDAPQDGQQYARVNGDWAIVISSGGGGSGTPAGDTTQVQFNNAGAFGADAKLAWTQGTGLSVGGRSGISAEGSAINITSPVVQAGATFADNFNRPDGPLGSNWLNSSTFPGIAIASNQAVNSASTWAISFVNPAVHTFAADQYAEVKYVSGSFAGPVVRWQYPVSESGYFCFVNPPAGGGIYVYRIDNGGFVGLGSWGSAVPGDTIRLAVSGSTLGLFVNGVSVISLTDATYTGGSPGIAAYNSIVDDFQAASGGGPTDAALSFALTSQGSGGNNTSWRNIIPLPLFAAGGTTRIRVTFKAIATGPTSSDTNHCSVGVWNGANTDCTATPVELLFGGASGFSILSGTQITSDWVDLPVVVGDKLVVILDLGGLGTMQYDTSSGSGANYANAPAASYNAATQASTGYTWNNLSPTGIMGVTLIEVQSTGGSGGSTDFAGLRISDQSGVGVASSYNIDSRGTHSINNFEGMVLAQQVTVQYDPVLPLEVATKQYADAPDDGFNYARAGSEWTQIGTYGEKYITDAPVDGNLYGRQNAAWTVITGGGSFPEAPLDGFAYGREMAGWTQVLRPTDVIDGGIWS